MKLGNNKILRLATNRFLMSLFMLKNLPLAFFAGLKVVNFSNERASVSIPYTFLNKNPFKSIYFAALSMAAELSTGILAMVAIEESQQNVSMLVLEMEAKFLKKARSKIVFTCEQGNMLQEYILKSIETGQGQSIRVLSEGFDNENMKVAEFFFTWTFKPKLLT